MGMLQVYRGDSGAAVLPRPRAGRYVVALGGTATLGKAVAQPFPALVEEAVRCPVVNLGAPNAGPDFYLADPARLQIAAQSQAAILQLAGAEGVTNAFYTVHNRRNDRFLGPTPALRGLFPDVDFAEIHFTRHLLSVLHRTDAARFAVVARLLRATWLVRMQALLRHLPPRRILLLLSRDVSAAGAEDPLHPAVLDRAMIAGLCAPETTLVEVTLPEAAPLPGACLPDAEDHRRIAAGLGPQVRRLLGGPPRLILRQADRVG
jgi:hypothetical protein